MRVALTGGAYQAKSVIAGAQRCVNLYPEAAQANSEEPSPVTHYLTPGLTLLVTASNGRGWRSLYRASNGSLYGVSGNAVWLISSSWSLTQIGGLLTSSGIVSMIDNGLCLVIVDGSSNGYAFTFASNSFAQISDPAFYGADRVDFVDTYFVFNRPGTAQFYISPSEWVPGISFDTLDLAAKTGASDLLASLICLRREIWLVGQKTTELWFNSGATDFTFQEMPGVFIEHGIAAKYSLAKYDIAAFWLSQDHAGQAIVVRGFGYQAARISTHAIEAEISQYATISDAIGYVYQQEGHVFYVLNFPTANKTWVWDEATKEWHERVWTDADGGENRHRGQVAAFAYNTNVIGDWQNGNLYAFDVNNFTDNGTEIVRRRGFPHMMNDGARQSYAAFIADMEVGELATDTPPLISLRWSDTRGRTWGNPVEQTMGNTGEYLTSIQWHRLGVARDRVFELFWSASVKTALNGAFIRALRAAT